MDSSPDRWGRVLLQRREAQRARTEKRREWTLVESDYLLGVYDGHRLGGLVLDVAKHFRVKAARANEIVGEVETAVRQWRAEAKRAGIVRAEQDRMASAFRLADGGA